MGQDLAWAGVRLRCAKLGEILISRQPGSMKRPNWDDLRTSLLVKKILISVQLRHRVV